MNVNSVRLANAYNVSVKDAQSKNSALTVQQTASLSAASFGADIGLGDTILSKEEFQYFEQLYPNSASEIQSYQSYRRDGSQSSLGTGSVVDRRG